MISNCQIASDPTQRTELVAPEARGALSRRQFLRQIGNAGIVCTAPALLCLRGAEAPNKKVRVGVMGASRNSHGGDGRGSELAVQLATLPGVEVGYVCDVDERNVPKAIESVMNRGKAAVAPKGIRDFRRILDDKSIDALVIATPDHWHAPAGILGCITGKHVYVEKPCCHNPHEGELLVMAARKYNRLVQHGTQRRSWPVLAEAVQKLRAGEIGRVLFAKAWYYGPRPGIGKGKVTPVPAWLDYGLWQGPAPERPYRDNVVHYNWHWFWHWGTGELGNNAVHYADLCRWGLGVDYPQHVTSSGGKYRFDDDQETPDTNVVSWEFGGTTISWEQRSWAEHSAQDPPFEVAFYGEKGMLTVQGAAYAVYDPKGNELSKSSSGGGDRVHLANFIDAIREAKPLNAEIEEGFKSALLCHLGNIAYRTGHEIHFESQARKIVGDPQAEKLWVREYQREWQPKI